MIYELQTSHYDIAQIPNPYALAALGTLVPVARIQLGTNCHFIPAGIVAKCLRDLGFSVINLHAIERDNAVAFFPKYKDE